MLAEAILLAILVGLFSLGYVVPFVSMVFKDHPERSRVAACIIAVVLLALYAFIWGWFITPSPHLPDIEQNYNISIYSSDLSSTTYGVFILGSGTVNTEFVFTFYRGNKTTGLTLDYFPASKSTLLFDGGNDPYVTVSWLFDQNNKTKIWKTDHYTFHLPENAVTPNYDMNLKGL